MLTLDELPTAKETDATIAKAHKAVADESQSESTRAMAALLMEMHEHFEQQGREIAELRRQIDEIKASRISAA